MDFDTLIRLAAVYLPQLDPKITALLLSGAMTFAGWLGCRATVWTARLAWVGVGMALLGLWRIARPKHSELARAILEQMKDARLEENGPWPQVVSDNCRLTLRHSRHQKPIDYFEIRVSGAPATQLLSLRERKRLLKSTQATIERLRATERAELATMLAWRLKDSEAEKAEEPDSIIARPWVMKANTIMHGAPQCAPPKLSDAPFFQDCKANGHDPTGAE